MVKHDSDVVYNQIVSQLKTARRTNLNVGQALHISSALLTRILQKRLGDLQIPLDSPKYIA